MLRFIVLAALAVVTQQAHADKRDIAKCAAIEGSAERLVCFDRLANSLGVAAPKSSTSRSGGSWTVREDVSPIDDSRNVFMSVFADEPVRSGYNQSRPALFIRCKENTTNVFLNWGLYLGLDTTRMLTRLDKEDANTSTWSISTDNKAVFVRGSDIGFAKSLFGHETLLAQITPYGESRVMATFDISGLEDAIKPLREACNW